MDRSEATRRLPTISLIADPEIRAETARLTTEAPAWFWNVPASTSGYHHPACRGDRGLWAHTLMVGVALERLVDSFSGRFDLEPDHARAAAVLHDQAKNGLGPDPADSSVSDHEILMSDYIRAEGDLPAEVADAVETHMGPWYDGPEPADPVERLVHNADMIASTATISVGLPEPVPHEIRDLAVAHDLPVVSL